MTSRLRGPSGLKETTKVTSYPKERLHEDHEDQRTYKNGNRENRYHFGMSRHEETGKNGRDYKETPQEDPDLLYRRSREHFGAWNIKDIVQEENNAKVRKDERFEDTRLTNGKAKDGVKQDNARQDRYESRDEGYVGSLPRENRRTESMDREQNVSHRSRKKESWEGPADTKTSRSIRNASTKENNDQRIDEKDLLREIESLTVDGRSPDRRIRAMIERFKTREEGKLRSRKEQNSLSPEREEHPGRSRSGARNESLDNRVDRDRTRPQKEDREDERRIGRSKLRESEKMDHEETRDSGNIGRSDRRSRSREKFGETAFLDKEEEPSRRSESFRQRNEAFGVEKNYRRRSRELEDEPTPRKDNSSKRRSYAYEGTPEDFDVRIQRYERALLEPRKDPETRRVSLKDSDHDLVRKESFKDHDRHPSRKNSFKATDSFKKNFGREREHSLGRKSSFKDQDNDLYRRNSLKNHTDENERYFGKDQEDDSPRKTLFKDHVEIGRKNSFKDQNSEYGRISFKSRDEEVERKNSFKGQTGGIRISFKDQDNDPTRIDFKDQDTEVGRVSFKEPNDVSRKNSFKEKTVEFGGISYKDLDDDDDDDDDVDTGYRNSYKDQDTEHNKVSFADYVDPDRKHSPNGRYVEFGKVSFKNSDEEPRRSPSKDHDDDLSRKTSFKDPSTKRRTSLRSKTRDSIDKRSDRHSRPLTPPKRPEKVERTSDPRVGDRSRDRETFDSRSWYESNKLFAAKYLRDNSKLRTNPEGHTEIVDNEQSPETSLSVHDPRDLRRTIEPSSNQIEVERHVQRNRHESIGFTAQNSGSRDHEGGRYSSTQQERNGATIIRIRSSPEDPATSSGDRRRRRRPTEAHSVRRRRMDTEEEEEEEEEEEMEEEGMEESEEEEEEMEEEQRQRSRRDGFLAGRVPPTPSRRVWNYREGGVLITDVEEGQPCLQCGETCPGFSPHTWRKNCTSCKCPRDAHDVCHEEWVSVRSRLGLKGEESTSPAAFHPRAKGLAWAPPGLPAHKVEEYFSMLPEISVPRLGTPGERHRDRQLAFQLPKQDLARAYCRHLHPKHASSADDFMAARNEIALDIGSVQEVLERDIDCGACNEPLKYGSLAVSASKLGLFYHPSCFRCSDCKELLVDLAYCVHDDTLYCERHYAEQLKPRCAACDELIFSGEYTKAMNKDWHSGHFCCWQCDESLTGQRYVLRDEHPYCIKCYESVFANGCEECNKIIGIDSKDLSYKDKHWHEACFLCNRCRVSLVDKQFGSKVDKIYCGNCYDAQFASRCDGCGEIFRAGTKKMEYKTRQWHEKCFCCVVCKNPIGTKSFIPREQEIYCAGCYEDKFATRCVKCNKIITSGGVTYKNEPWHRDCFTCSNCNNSLAGQRFTSRDDKPYCADCFGELFAKRCTACSKPITGIGGTRFISFEDRHWHNDCFICAGCKTSLVGRGFITDGEDIICPECAKMKLM